MPDGVPLEVGASIGIPLMTAYHAVTACGSLLGCTVVVFGAAGSVGYYATQLAKLAGGMVIAVVSSDDKADLARGAGADQIVNYREDNVPTRIRTLTSGRGADFIIDVDAAVNGGSYGDLLAFGGKVVVYGSGQALVALPFAPMIRRFVTLYFFIVYLLPADLLRRTVEGVTDLLNRSVLKHPTVAVFSLEDIAAAHQQVERGANAKVLIKL